ncbi:MAG: lipid-A-disaccharide synthase [Candidatus Makaraimicrobium thalassicum]|nr:MAG: lipid-A-disaccharide synthase [Candidatus Omnitrophota bacterium]
MMNRNILIITGEPSGDMRAGELLKELKKLLPEASFWGIGGDCMAGQGAELIEHVRKLSIVGVWEAVKDLSRIRRQYKNTAENIRKRRPGLAILVDYPGFNLSVARFLRRENIPVVYYILPQVWAWGRWRIRSLKSYTDRILVLFRFEKEFLEQAGVDCEFVGHPLLDTAPLPARREPREPFTIALLPGSRKSEILNMLPVLLDTAEKIHERQKDVHFIVAENSNIDKALYDPALAGHSGLSVSRVTDNTFAALDRCDLAVVTSGTATLETAIMGKPMVITYRAAILTYVLFRIFAKTPFLGLTNIIAGKEVAPELLQGNATPEKLSRKILEIMNDGPRMQRMRDELKEVAHALGEKGASRRAAEAITRFISEKPKI